MDNKIIRCDVVQNGIIKGKVYKAKYYNWQFSDEEARKMTKITSIEVKRIYNFNIFGIEIEIKIPLLEF